MCRATGSSGSPGLSRRSRFRVARTGFAATPSAGDFHRRVHPLVRLRSSPECLELRPPHGSHREAPPMRFRSPSRHQPTESTGREGAHTLAKFRPRRFSRPRRFPPPTALQVYFTPQPRPGFTLQGFSPSRSRTTIRPPPALVPVGASSLPALPPAPEERAPPSGLSSARGSVATYQILAGTPPDPLLSFSSFGFSFVCRGDVFGRRLLHP